MKLQSQATVRFDREELRRLAERTRPRRGWRTWATAGAIVGAAIVAAMRLF